MMNPFSDVSDIIYTHWVLGGFTVNQEYHVYLLYS